MNNEELLETIDAKLDQLNPAELIEPESIHPVAIMTRERRQLGELEKELLQILDLVKMDERVPSIITRLANVYLKEATFGRAIVLYELTLGFNSKQVSAWINMGLAYLMVSSPKEAISCLGSALALDQRNALALVYLGMAQLKLEEFNDANANLDRAISIDSNMARALLGKGEYFRARGEPEVAVTWIRRALS
ncbi:MAG: tetratricopeptide repeat protein, partial [Candidatus Thorarchaeota archaeon]